MHSALQSFAGVRGKFAGKKKGGKGAHLIHKITFSGAAISWGITQRLVEAKGRKGVTLAMLTRGKRPLAIGGFSGNAHKRIHALNTF